MTSNELRTYWPLNLRFTEGDIRLGEQLLESSDLFLHNGLRLLYNVNLRDLSRSPGSQQSYDRLPHSLLDYLVCKGDAVLLAIHLTNRMPWYGRFVRVPDLPMAETTAQKLVQGDVSDILETLETVVQAKAPPVWSCRLAPCPPELTEALLDGMLLEQQRDGSLLPTEYGACQGLVQAREPDSSRRTLCTPRTAFRLQTQLSHEERRKLSEGNPEGRVSFQVILNTYRSGLSIHGYDNANLVQEVMDMPLEQYMDGFPSELEQLEDALPGQCAAYGQAALEIAKMLQSAIDPDDEQYQLGVDLMRCLAAPPLSDLSIFNGIQMGRSLLGRNPDTWPQRYQKLVTSKPIHSFSDCLSRTTQVLPANIRLSMLPMAGFFQGVSILTESVYPLWLGQILPTYLKEGGRCTYASMLRMADCCMQYDDDTWFMSLGPRLFYLALIEPYCLIHQNNCHSERKVIKHVS